jgi:hypothetical protein
MFMIYQESNSKWITTTFRVQFKDSTTLESFSGCYHIDVHNKINNRYIYTSDTRNAEASKLGYCLKQRKWLFFEDVNSNSSDPCSAQENELAHSSRTTSYDVSTLHLENWFSFSNRHLEMYVIKEDNENVLNNNCGSFVHDGVCDPMLPPVPDKTAESTNAMRQKLPFPASQ